MQMETPKMETLPDVTDMDESALEMYTELLLGDVKKEEQNDPANAARLYRHVSECLLALSSKEGPAEYDPLGKIDGYVQD
ncbi:hypothetical protein KY362_07455 [Candidatus Woesearchaeota archaeon]|nr:hypothetical protein [Candidatus Woesearchaeota archaeon]